MLEFMSTTPLVLPGINDLLFFGKFNPITLGHQYAIELGLEFVQPTNGVILLPTLHDVWGRDLLPFNDRVEMLKLHLQKVPRSSISLFEQENNLTGYTIDTLKLYKKFKPLTSLGLLLGNDAVQDFIRWKDWKDILDLCYLFVVPRDLLGTKKELPIELSEYINDRIFMLPSRIKSKHSSYSSTLVRIALKEKKDTPMITQEVKKYIDEHRLYSKTV